MTEDRKARRARHVAIHKVRGQVAGEKSFSAKTACAIRSLPDAGMPASWAMLCEILDLDTEKEKNRLSTALRDLKRAGKITSPVQGQYVWAGKTAQQKRDAFWKILRARHRVTVIDLMTLCGASREYAQDWLLFMDRNGYTRPSGSAHILVRDPGPVHPDIRDNANKCKSIRDRKKEALEFLQDATTAVSKAFALIHDMEV